MWLNREKPRGWRSFVKHLELDIENHSCFHFPQRRSDILAQITTSSVHCTELVVIRARMSDLPAFPPFYYRYLHLELDIELHFPLLLQIFRDIINNRMEEIVENLTPQFINEVTEQAPKPDQESETVQLLEKPSSSHTEQGVIRERREHRESSRKRRRSSRSRSRSRSRERRHSHKKHKKHKSHKHSSSREH